MSRDRGPSPYLSECRDDDTLFSEYVAPGKRREAIPAIIWRSQGADEVCGPSFVPCDQRVCIFGVRGFRRSGDGWPRRVGSHIDLAREQGPAATRCDYPVSRFAGFVLQRIHKLFGVSEEQR